LLLSIYFFSYDPATTDIYTLSLHDALPISIGVDWPIRYADIAPWYDHVERHAGISGSLEGMAQLPDGQFQPPMPLNCGEELIAGDRKSSRLNSSHVASSYAVFCLKKKKHIL